MTEKQMVLDFVDAKIESLEDYLDNLRPEEEFLRGAPEHDLIMFKKIKEILELAINNYDLEKRNEWLEQIIGLVIVNRLNDLSEELTTHISDEDFEMIEKLFKKYYDIGR